MAEIVELVRNAVRSISEKTRQDAYRLLVEGGMKPEDAARNAGRVADKVKMRSAVAAAIPTMGGQIVEGAIDSAQFFDDAIRGRVQPSLLDPETGETVSNPEYMKGILDLAMNVGMPSMARSVTRGGRSDPNTLGIFGTTDARKAPIETLDAAKAMQKQGADANDIWRQTGWGFDPTDQKWKFEIDDSASRVLIDKLKEPEVREPRRIMSNRDRGGFVSRGRERPAAAPQKTLGDVYDHPELYANYDISGTPIVKNREVQNSGFVRGMYDHRNNVIDVNRTLDEEGLRSVLAHEGNHNVQGIAGMTRGTSPAAAGSYDAYRYSPGEGGPFGSYNVEKRLNMTADERRRTTPFETADAGFSGRMPTGDAPAMSLMRPPLPGILDFSGQYSPRADLLPPGSGYTPVPGKPGVVSIPGIGQVEARPVGILNQAADAYMTKTGNPGAHRAAAFPEFDEAKATRIANAFEAMPHNPADPAVKRSYDALIEETLAQGKALQDAGVDIRFLKEGMSDPYATSPAMGYADLVKNNRLYVFPTDFGFGSSSSFNPVDNPLLKGIGRFGDKPNAVANDAFRAVHDLFGHFAPGNPFFRHKGEDRAWNVHSRMFSPEARGAMTTETRGQNSWLNFGPYGDFNKTASGADTKYADQKIGLLPDWVWRDEEFR
jgi:hypothetical protein